ncbi:MAG: hypothetical protein JNL03_09805 [Prolixibacteraceae bacterium]|nr:hypothetical protein [Prolixibacteraceae bacterium]
MEKEELILAFHYAMLTNIKSNFRMICIDWNTNKWIKIRVYSDTDPCEDDYELVSCILTDLSHEVVFEKWIKEVIYCDIPLHELDRLQCVLYARHE